MMLDHDDEHDEELRQTARRLGAHAADRVDVERTAQAVLARLRAGDASARGPIRWMQPAWMRAAAAVVVIMGAGVLTYRTFHVHPQVIVIDSSTIDVGEFTPDQLAAVGEMTPTARDAETGLEELSATQLQSLLKAMED